MAVRGFQFAFTGGEYSPRLGARMDWQKYQLGADRLKNMVVDVRGGADRRAGTLYIHDAFRQDWRSWLYDYRFSNEQAYILEFSGTDDPDDGILRIFTNRRILTGDGDGSELLTNGDFATDLSGWTVTDTGTGTTIWAAPGQAQLDGGASGHTRIGQAITTVIGTEYVVAWNATWSLTLEIGTSSGDFSILQEYVGGGMRKRKFTATTTTTWVQWSTTEDVTIDLDDASAQVADPIEIAVPYTNAQMACLRLAPSADTIYITHPDVQMQKLLRITAIEWEVRPVNLLPPLTRELPESRLDMGTLTPSATSGPGVTFTSTGVPFIASDVGRLIRGGAGRASITAVGSASSVTADVIDDFSSTDPIAAGLWALIGSPRSQVTPSADGPVGATITLTGDIDTWRVTDLGKYVRIDDGFVKLTSVTSSTVAEANVIVALTSVDPAEAGTWFLEEPVWSDTRGWPGACCFHEQRLVLGGSVAEPLTFAGSRVADFENFYRGADDADAYDYQLPGPFNSIRWLVSLRKLLIGTGGGVFQARGADQSAITPTSIYVVQENDRGSRSCPAPVVANNALLFILRGGTRVLETAYNFADDAYNAVDLSITAEHLMGAGLVQLARVSAPDSYVLAVRADGALLVCTYVRAEGVVAWVRWITGRAQDLTDGQFESVAVIPNPCDSGDEIWVEVRRLEALAQPVGILTPGAVSGSSVTFTTDGASFTAADVGKTLRNDTGTGLAVITAYVDMDEVTVDITETWASTDPIATGSWSLYLERRFIEVVDGAVMVDSALTYDGAATTELEGLDHLAGELVQLVVDGADSTATVDAAGVVTIPSGTTAQAGLKYHARVRTLRPEHMGPIGPTMARVRRISDAVVRFYCAGPGWTINGQTPNPAITGGESDPIQDRRVVNLGSDRDGRITVEQLRPYAGTVLAIGGRMEVESDG